MFFLKSKTITNRQTLGIGFVLAVLSLLSMAVITYVLPMGGAWLNNNGVTELDLFYTAFIFIMLLATQALILFGFPLYYARDQKSHMTGFRILLASMFWMVVMMLFTGLIFVKIHQGDQDEMSLEDYLNSMPADDSTVPADTTDTTDSSSIAQ